MTLDAAVTVIKGVGEVLATKLAGLGVRTVREFIYFFPRRYDDFSQVVSIADLTPGKVTIKGVVESVVGRHVRRGMHITEAVIADGTAKTRAVWFNQSYRAKQLAKGETYYFSGEYALQRNRYVLSNPASEHPAKKTVSTGRIVPIYPESRGLASHQLRKLLHELLPLMRRVPETLPTEIAAKQKLMPLGEALETVHFPQDDATLVRAKERMAFEELLQMILAGMLNKQEAAALKGWHIPFDAQTAKEFTGALAFTLTNAQRTAAWEILQDFEKGEPMNRLLQGDVGSGKTAVAAMAAYMAAKSGLQTAFMAPTEILATQHAGTLATLLEPLGVRVALLVGSTPKKAKEQLKAYLAQGKIDVIVGTHALIQPDSKFHKLGFVVIDEQHRFGVRQRAELLTQSAHMPHLLSMTATPIPRSLQLTLYGELEISILDELPKGRQPIATSVVAAQKRSVVYEKIDAEIAAGRQAYVVCPLVADGKNSELKSVEAEHKRLNATVFKHRRVGLLHGQLKADEKEAVMASFKKGELDIIICTTVIEVGVDVPNATVMLIEGAERFGLAQLHQLRGRVGRGAQQSYCYLVPSLDKAVSRRLRELEQSNDGFYLAEVDLTLRGPGQIYGRAQHGALDLTFANLADTKMIKKVRTSAQFLIDNKVNLLQYKQLHEQVSRYQRLTTLN